MMDWYSLRVISGKEKKIRDSLLFELEREGYSAKVGQVFVPSENIVEMRDGKKRVRNKVFFPGYLLIKIIFVNYYSPVDYVELIRSVAQLGRAPVSKTGGCGFDPCHSC